MVVKENLGFRRNAPRDSGAPITRRRQGSWNAQSRSNSLIDVLARVFSSTRLTITAQ
jgi:hypothetical protein